MGNSKDLKPCPHRYLTIENYAIPSNAKILILGTIHPCTDDCIEFFYGNTYSLWDVLACTGLFKGIPAKNMLKPSDKTELPPKIYHTLEEKGLAVSDSIADCSRAGGSASDTALRNICYNTKLMDTIKNNPSINTLIFTGKMARTKFTCAFWETTKRDIKADIKMGDIAFGEWFKFCDDYFGEGRVLHALVLPSPSPRANSTQAICDIYTKGFKEAFQK